MSKKWAWSIWQQEIDAELVEISTKWMNLKKLKIDQYFIIFIKKNYL